MAHGYLSPEQPGEADLGYLKTIGDLLAALGRRGKKNGKPPATGGALAIVNKGQGTDVYQEPPVTPVKVQEIAKKGGALAKRGASALGGAFTSMMQRGGPGAVASVGAKALPSGGPRLPGAKGGTTTDMGGAITRGLNGERFFQKAVSDGIDANTGDYLSKEARIAAFKAGRPEPTSEVGLGLSGGGGGDIVAALAQNTAAIVRMEEATKAQTANDTQLANQEIQASEAMFDRQLALTKENALEKGSDLSGVISPSKSGDSKAGGGAGGGILGALGGLLGGKGGGLLKGVGGALKGLKGLGGKLLGKGAAKGATKGLLKGGLKMGIKKIPIAGLLAGGLFAAQRAMAGDLAGAGMELASGGASMIPGFGTAASLGIDAALMARDASIPQASGGAILSGPKSGYPAIMHGTEMVLSGNKSKETIKIGEALAEGQLKVQKKKVSQFARVAGEGLKFYFERMFGFGFLLKGIGALIARIPGVAGAADLLKGAATFFGNMFGLGGGQVGGPSLADPNVPKGSAAAPAGMEGALSPGTNLATDITSKIMPSAGTALKGNYDSFLGGRPTFTSAFGFRDNTTGDASTDHPGIDIGVDPDSEVLNIQDGIVTAIDQNFGTFGKGIEVTHADGSVNVYGHVDPQVKVGDDVKAGDKIAMIRYWPSKRYPLGRQHLHFERYEGGGIKDPQTYLNMLRSQDQAAVDKSMKKMQQDKNKNQPQPTPTGGFTSGRNYGLTSGQSLDVGVKGKNYTFTKTDKGWDVTTGGFFGLGKEKVDPTKVPGLIEAFEQRYQNRGQPNLTPANQDQAAAVVPASSQVASAERAAAGAARTTVVTMPEVASAGGPSAVPIVADPAGGSESQGLQMYSSLSIMRSA